MAWPIRFVFLSVATLGVWAALANETGATRPHFTLLACVLCAVFMGVYAFQPWRSTYAGRAAMVFTSATFVWSLNATLILWWPGSEYGYPGWETGTELVYVYVALAIAYKLFALLDAVLKKSDG
nr:MAG TPA: hypothetical protein [Caudoviricetes sp.]